MRTRREKLGSEVRKMMNNSNDTFIYESQNETVVITGRLTIKSQA